MIFFAENMITAIAPMPRMARLVTMLKNNVRRLSSRRSCVRHNSRARPSNSCSSFSIGSKSLSLSEEHLGR